MTFKKEVKRIKDDLKKQRKQVEALEVAALNDTLKLAFQEIKGLNRFFIQGYTPSFNDGSPCVHRQYAFITASDFSDNGLEDRMEDMFKGLSPVASSVCPFTGDQQAEFNKLGVADALVLADLVSNDLEQATTRLHVTNFMLTVSRDPTNESGFTLHKEGYDCGY